MNKKLQNQIKAYVSAAGAILLADKASGQIVYVNINPDTVLNIPTPIQAFYNLDMNQDGTTDFNFSASKYLTSSSGQNITVRSFNLTNAGNNAIMGFKVPLYSTSTSSVWVPKKLNQGDAVASQNWNDATYPIVFAEAQIGSQILHFGNFNLADDAYVGVKLNFGGQVHFGWIRVEIVNHESFKIKSFAYQSQANTMILAGDTGNGSTGINELIAGSKIFSNQNVIYINTTNLLNDADVKIFDLLGKEIIERKISGTETQIAMDKKGIYMVEVSSGDRVIRKKVFIAP